MGEGLEEEPEEEPEEDPTEELPEETEDNPVPLGPDKKDPNNGTDESSNNGRKTDNTPEVIPGPDSNGQYHVPATGDEQFAAVWLALMGMSVLMIVFCAVFFVRKAKRR